MSWSRHILQSVELQAVTQARASGDYHPGDDQWIVGITSIFADAVAIRPTKDNWWTTPGQSNSNRVGTGKVSDASRLPDGFLLWCATF